jgi:hypothetical protein
MDPKFEQLRQQRRGPVGLHRSTAVNDPVQKLEDFRWCDRARIPAAPLREHVAGQDVFSLLRVLAVWSQVAHRELADQVVNAMVVLRAERSGGLRRGPHAPPPGTSASRVDALIHPLA